VGALANEEVGDYLTTHFVAAFQKVGAFRIAGGKKQGGNVAGYFCTPDGEVLHVLAGPVGAATFLREARWAVETWKLARLEAGTDAERRKAFFARAHAGRLQQKHGRRPGEELPAAPAALLDQTAGRGLSSQEQVHLLLSEAPLVGVEQVYQSVFERILGERVSTSPVTTEAIER
jgi:hypothetical protein